MKEHPDQSGNVADQPKAHASTVPAEVPMVETSPPPTAPEAAPMPQPQVGSVLPPVTPQPVRPKSRRVVLTILLFIVAIVSGFGGSFLWLKSGLISIDATKTITQNRDKIVLQQGEIVADVVKKVGPSVVSIIVQSSSIGADDAGAGSGFVISSNGYIMTNRHVVPAGSGNVTVIMSDGKRYNDVEVVGRDTINDVAFLKISNVNNLTPVELGDSSKVTPGQQVVAIGNALGVYQNSVTSGIISGLGRPVTAEDELGGGSENLDNLFQTDTAINPGNSGGPLMNLNGEVIGVNTAVAQDAQGIGFAIPIDDVKGLAQRVIETGRVERATLGVRYMMLDDQLAESRQLSVNEGALITPNANESAIVSGSPAEKAGLKSGDVITKVNDQVVDRSHSLGGIMAQFNPGERITITFMRDGKSQTATLTLE